jgi:uncharacterized membrane protein (DUF106 family)
MEKKPSLLQFALTYGAILGVVSVIFSIIMYIAGFMPTSFSKMFIVLIISLGISIIFVSAGMKGYRDKVLDGSISFGQAFLVGMSIIVVSAIIGSLYNLIFTTIIDPDYMDRVMEATKNSTYEWMNSKGLPDAQIEEAMDKMDKQKEGMTPLKNFSKGLISSLIFGAILSLIIAAFTKKNRNPVM